MGRVIKSLESVKVPSLYTVGQVIKSLESDKVPSLYIVGRVKSDPLTGGGK